MRKINLNNKKEFSGNNYWYKIGKETEKAILVELWYDGGKLGYKETCHSNFWLPKSQAKISDSTLEIADWLYDKNISYII